LKQSKERKGNRGILPKKKGKTNVPSLIYGRIK